VRRERDPLPQRLMWPDLVFQRCCRQDDTRGRQRDHDPHGPAAAEPLPEM